MASPTPYATNAFGVSVQPLDYTKAGAPTTMSYHGGTIVVGGNIVGRINSWQPAGAYTREGVHIYEVNKNTWGNPVDYVPGRATGFNITFTRAEVWGQEVELTFGYGQVFNVLTDQNYPFEADEYLFKGTDVYRVWKHTGCWMTEKNPDSWSSDGDGVYKVNCGMAYVRRQRTT